MTYRVVSTRNPEIYGVTGEKGHGKDTFARLVREYGPSFEVLHFADDLKRIAGRVYGLTDAQMNDPALKEQPLEKPIDMDLFVDALRGETALPIQPRSKVGRSPREVMQYLGTEYVRSVQDDYWVQRVLRGIGTKRRFLVPDTRFPNESEGLRSVHGLVIKVLRIDAPTSGDKHASETEIAKIQPDLTIGVRTGDLSLPKRVAKLIATNKFDSALRYDYDRAKKAIAAYLSGKSAKESAQELGSNHKDPYCLYNTLDYYGIPRRRQAPTRVPHQMVNGLECKVCGKCGEPKTISEFNDCTKAWDGLSGLCRPCASQGNKDRYQKYSRNNTLKAIFAQSRRNAGYRGIEFALTFEDIERLWATQKGTCAYSGRVMTTDLRDPHKVTIDRKDSTKGYTSENVALCCLVANLMKRDLSMDEFRAWVQDIAREVDNA